MMGPRLAHFPFIPSGESRELAEDIRELFDDLAANLEPEHRASSGECQVSLDVLEHDESVEIVVDASGMPPNALRVLFRGGVLIVAGEKAPARIESDHTFHLVEREFGRFSRAVRLAGAFDIQRAHATLLNGELTVVLPKLIDRRGSAHLIHVASGGHEPA
jgi:HSP20 family protein